MKKYIINRIDGKVASVQSVKSLLSKTYRGKQITIKAIDEKMTEINSQNGASHFEYWSVDNQFEDVLDFLLGDGNCKVGKDIRDLCTTLNDFGDEVRSLENEIERANEILTDIKEKVRIELFNFRVKAEEAEL